MKTKPVEREDEYSFASFVEKIQSMPVGFTQGGNGPAVVKEKNKAVVFLKNEIPELPKPIEIKEEVLEKVPEGEDNSLERFLEKAEAEPAESKKEVFPMEQDPVFMSSFLVELVHTIKNSLASIYHGAVLGWEKGGDAEKRTEVHNKVKEDIKKIDSVLNSLLNFININTPITRSNTLPVILEDIFEANEKQLQEKNIRVVKRCEKNLPETYLHSEQARFVLHSILQYAVFLTPAHETIWVLMKSTDNPDGWGNRGALPENKGYVEVMIGFNGDRKFGIPMKSVQEVPRDQRETVDLILTLAGEILQKNNGMMIMENSGNRPKTLITVRFPIERRKVVYYAPITL